MKKTLPAIAVENQHLSDNRILRHLAFFIALLLGWGQLEAATFTSSGTGNWSASATWGGAGVPGSSDNVIISHGTTVTVNGAYTCNNLTIGDATATAATVTVSSTNSLTINGVCSINPSNVASTFTLNAAAGNVNIAGTLLWSTSGTDIIEANSGNMTITPAVTISSANQAIKVTSSGGTVSFLSAVTDNNNKISAVTGGIIKFESDYTVSTTASTWATGTAVFYNTSVITANSNLTLFNMQTAPSASTTLASAVGTVIIGGAVTIGSGSTFTTNENFEIDGNWTNSGGTFTQGSNTVTFNGATSLSGTTPFTTIQIGNTAASNTVTLTLNNSINCTGIIINGYNKARTLTVSSGDTLTVNGDVVINQPTAAKTNTLSVNGGTCFINGNLTLNGTVTTASFASKITVTTGLLVVSGTVSFDANTVAANQQITLTSTGTITFMSPLIMAYGTLSSTGTGTINLNGSEPSFTFGGASAPSFSTTNGCTVNFMNGFINNSNTLTFASTSNCNFTANGTIVADAPITFGNVQFNGVDSLASTGSMVQIAGNCYVAPAATFNALQDISLTGNLLNVGLASTYLQASGTLSAFGDVVDSGAINATDGTISLQGNGSNIGGIGNIDDPTGIILIANDKTITSGSSLTFGFIGSTALNVATNTTISNGGSIIFKGGIIGTDSSSTWLNNVNGYLSVTGEFLDTGSVDASTVPNTIVYNGTGPQIITAPINSYYNLTILKTGLKTLIAPVQADNAVSLSGSVVVNEGMNPLTGLASLTMTDTSVLELQRNTSGTYPELAGTYFLSSGTIILSQTASPAVVTGANYYNLVLTGTDGFDVSNISAIINNLTLDTGAFINNSNSLTVDNMFLDSSSAYSTLYGPLTAYGIGLYAGTLDDGGQNITVNGQGGWTNSGGTFNTTGITTFYSKFGFPQIIGGSTPTTFYYLQIDNPGDNVTLGLSPAAPTVVSGTLDLTSGNLETDASNILRMLAGSVVVNASSGSYVAGPMIKVGTDAFVFPLGKGGHFGQAGITGMTNAATEVTGEYFDVPYSTLSPIDSTLTQVSSHEYWTIERGVTTDSVQLQLFWADAAFSNITQCTNLTIAHYTGGEWLNVPAAVTGGSTCSGVGNGNIQSTGYINSFSPFTFGSSNDSGGKALPVTLIAFNAAPQGRVVFTNWQTAVEINNNYFTVERSADGREFESIGTVKGAGNSTSLQSYRFTDQNPLPGVSYYRLNQTDFNGNSVLSDMVAVNLSSASSFTLYPNPAKGEVFVSVVNPSAQTDIHIYNVLGDMVFSKTYTDGNGSNEVISIPTAANFAAGIYTVSVNTNGNIVNEKLVVQ